VFAESLEHGAVETVSIPLTWTYLLTYLLTPRSRVLPEKLKRPELLKKFPAFMEPEGS
jgi:hypothetical protein